MTDEEKIGFGRMVAAGRTIATLDDETIARIQAPIMERLARVESAVEEILYFTNVANGTKMCWKCKKRIWHQDPLTLGSDGKFYHSECFDEKEMPR